ncbi:Lactate utilization protein C [compost metagenome]
MSSTQASTGKIVHTDPEFLNKLDQQALEKQAAFMTNIANRLGRPTATQAPAHPFRGAPDFWKEFELTLEQKIELFSENWRKAGGHPVVVSNMKAAADFIEQLANDTSAKFFIRQDQPELEALELESRIPDSDFTVWHANDRDALLAKAAGADMGIVLTDYAVAYTGSLVLQSSPLKGRSVSLLPTIMVAIIPVDRLFTRLGEAMTRISALGDASIPAGVHFVSGPSRSADIENDLTIGVHGPGIVYAILVNDN